MRFSSLRSSFTFCPTKVPVDFPGVTFGGTKLVFPRTGGVLALTSAFLFFSTLAGFAEVTALGGGAERLEPPPFREGHNESGHNESMDAEHAESSAAEKTIVNWGIIRAIDRALPALKVEIIHRDKPVTLFLSLFPKNLIPLILLNG